MNIREQALSLRDVLVRCERVFCGAMMFALMAVVFWGVLERYLFRTGTGWTDETARYLCIWSVLIATSLGVVHNSHVGIEVFIRLLPTRAQYIMEKIVYTICGLFTLWIALVGWKLVAKLLNSMQLTATLEIPIAYIYLAVPVSALLMSVHYALQFVLVDKPSLGGEIQEEQLI